MPRKKLQTDDRLYILSILDENGEVETDLAPDIDDQKLLNLYRTMYLARRFDERLIQLQRQGRIGTFPPISGQEAAQVGAVAAMRSEDWLVPSFRETAAEIWRGRTLENIIIANNGLNEGGAIPAASRDFPISIPVGSQIPHAVGLAWAAKYRRTDEVVMVFFGDGATSEGDFHEAMNAAAVFQVPLVLVCQNNHWAISMPSKSQTRSNTIVQKAIGYGMPGIQVDGNDVLAVYSAADEAVRSARTGKGPTFIECVTYRLLMHTTADDPKRYRSETEVEQWQRRDPLSRFEKYLINQKLLTRKSIDDLESEIAAEIRQAVEHAEAQMQSMGDPLDMFDHLYAQMPPFLEKQKRMLQNELAASNREDEHD